MVKRTTPATSLSLPNAPGREEGKVMIYYDDFDDDDYDDNDHDDNHNDHHDNERYKFQVRRRRSRAVREERRRGDTLHPR